jgi:pantoate--beta-alanine ligase
MKIIRTIHELRHEVALARRAGSVGFVPTMGALHVGHASLFTIARVQSDVVVVSIFVNPTQFNDPKDLALYPRPEAADARLSREAGVDLLFIPSADEMYPEGFASSVHVEGAALGFEGDHRPGHFDGVATVCLKLFSIVGADRAIFGQKDAQQVAVIRQIVADFHLPLEIVVGPTLRDPDGLAMSSRNVRLSAAERAQALAIPRALRAGLRAYARGGDPAEAARPELAGLDVDYVGVASFAGDPTLVIAARSGATRLIDNVPLRHPDRAGFADLAD